MFWSAFSIRWWGVLSPVSDFGQWIATKPIGAEITFSAIPVDQNWNADQSEIYQIPPAGFVQVVEPADAQGDRGDHGEYLIRKQKTVYHNFNPMRVPAKYRTDDAHGNDKRQTENDGHDDESKHGIPERST